jgi:GT2 family glycosyltransferase/glycosyltransferase involved in cell wall biosynthesis
MIGSREHPRAISVQTLFVSYSGAAGGSERILLDVLAGAPTPPVLACPAGALATRARDAGVIVLELPQRRLEARAGARDRAAAPLRLVAHAAEIRRLARDLDPAVVVAWGARSALAAATVPRPVVFAHVDLLPDSSRIARAVRSAAARCEATICLSQTIADDLGIAGDGVHVVLPGVRVPDEQPAPPSGAPSALLLGAIVGWKRPDLALEAAARVPGLALVVCGPRFGEEGAHLLTQLRERAGRPDLDGRVALIDGVEDPEPLLARSTLLLHAAEREPYGMVVAEALAAGRAVVVPSAGGPTEIADERCGLFYAPGDVAAAAAALARLAGDPDLAASMGVAGWERARTHLRVEDSVARWWDVVSAVPGSRRAGPRRDAGAGIALVTVTHNSRDDLGRLLSSVSRHLPGARVVVVDSGSEDDSLDVARAWPGQADVLDAEANVGFGRASNLGVAAVGDADVVVLVNPDVELVDDSLDALAGAVRSGPDRLLAPMVLSPDGTRQDTAQPAPASAPLLAHALAPAAVLPGPLRRAVEPFRARRPRPVGWAVGCAVAGRTETLRRLGPFDKDAFLYAEDLDLGLRATARGVETWFWPAARVIHRRAHSSDAAYGGEPFELLARRRREVVAERLGPGRAAMDDALQALTFANRALIKTLLRRDAGRERRQLAALRATRRGR